MTNTSIHVHAVPFLHNTTLLVTWGPGIEPTAQLINEMEVPADAVQLNASDLAQLIKWAAEQGYLKTIEEIEIVSIYASR